MSEQRAGLLTLQYGPGHPNINVSDQTLIVEPKSRLVVANGRFWAAVDENGAGMLAFASDASRPLIANTRIGEPPAEWTTMAHHPSDIDFTLDGDVDPSEIPRRDLRISLEIPSAEKMAEYLEARARTLREHPGS